MKLNLLIIASFPPPYHGASIYVKKLREALLRDGEFEIYVIDTSDHRDDINNLGKLDFLNIYSALKSIFKLVITLLKNKIDVVYIPISQNALAYFRDAIFILISKLFGSKVVVHLHGSYFRDFYDKSPKFYKKIIDISIKKVDGAIVLGEKLRYIFQKWLPDKKIYVLPNFIKWNFEITRDLKTKFNHADKPVVISYLGNLIVS
ncbi:MAG: glycosyltransferase, partial [Elusimicrobiota bacterium]|nr:glycosyltransferase [Endomicrobiia bacterium]MDW8166666.1 glycosyltransferase [Elusimicrobiota bacterium]